MNQATANQLITLNRQFYQTFALQFSSTRQRIQPGVRRVITSIPLEGDLLDLGCGNGQLWLALRQAGFSGRYTGLDASPGMVEIARRSAAGATGGGAAAVFLESDLAQPGWVADLENARTGMPARQFQAIFAFAVLHHLPGRELRLALLRQIATLLDPGGRFIHSEWQFLNSPRLAERIQPWSAAGVDEAELEPGDYLLDWRSGGQGLRYVHLFSANELAGLAEEAGFEISATFFSDGKSGDLAVYQVWRAKK